MNESTWTLDSPAGQATIERAIRAKSAAAALVERATLAQEHTRAAIAHCLSVRDRVADIVWSVDLERRNPGLARHMADTRRRYSGLLGRAPEIERAADIVSRRYGCSPTEAFALMRSVSQRTNRKLAVVAASIVEQNGLAEVSQKGKG